MLDPTPTPTLTLTTCHPKYSAKERLVVVANLAPGQKATAATPSPTPAPGDEEARPVTGLGDPAWPATAPRSSTILWGVLTLLIGLGWWLAIRKWRHWFSYVGGVVPFLVSLFFFYAHLELLLPANF